MTQNMDREAHAQQMSNWAESDAALNAARHSTTPRDTAAGRQALAAFRQAGRPRLDGNSRATGRAPRRQVRLPAELNTALDTYASQNDTTASEVIRQALHRYLDDAAA